VLGIDPTLKAVQAITLCPTRELAVQVATEASRIGHHHGVKVVTIYGGASMRAQVDALEAGAQYVVGTPGRVKDLIRRGHLRFKDVRFCVLDEADEMLSMGFWEEVTSILDQLPKERQTMLFSATLPEQIERAARQYLKEPERLNLSADSLNVTTIRHVYHLEREELPKPRNFLYVLEFHRPRSAIVFCNRRDETELICAYLRRFGFRAAALNGDMPQNVRERVLKQVKAGELDLMVATDVAARGIDISDLHFVFNYDLPDFDEVYVHRSGRTGRIGKKGTAVSLVRGRYQTHLSSLMRDFSVPFEAVKLPPDTEILWMQAERLATQIIEEAEGVEVEQYRPVAESMLERGDIKEILAFLLRSHYSSQARSAPSTDEERTAEQEDRGPRHGPARDRGPTRDRGPARERRPDEARAGAPPDRGPRREARGDEEPAVENTTTANLYVTLGKDDGLPDLRALVQHMAKLSGVDDAHFTGAGDIRDHSSHVEVDIEVADQIIEGVNGKPRGDAEVAAEGAEGPRAIRCERAKPMAKRRPRGGGGRSRPRRS
jgi:ATP-dependent RNA helicase DeaD